jgi:hypothetical protein
MPHTSARPALGLLTLAFLLGGATAAHCQDYAASVVSSNLTSAAPYNNPNAVLGQPTTLFSDTLDTPAGVYHASMVAAPFNTDSSEGNDLIASLGNMNTGSGSLIVKMASPITHSDSHWYGDDFIVYGVASFSDANYDFVTPTTDMSQFVIADQGPYTLYQNGAPTVSVSADGVHFTQLSTSQVLLPTNSYSWAGISSSDPSGWGALNDFTKPVDPSLTVSSFVGQNVAYADNTLYDGSAGGQAFSLAGSGLSTINYIEFTGFGSIDGVVGVSDAPAAVPEASSVISLGLLLGLGLIAVRRSRKPSHQAAL